MAMVVDDADLRALRVLRIDQDVPCRRHDHGRHPEQCGAAEAEPLITNPTCYWEICSPRLAKPVHIRIIDGQRIRSRDFQVAEVYGHVLNVDFRVHQHLKKGRGRIGSAIYDSLADGVPAAGSTQTTATVQREMIADAPEDQAKTP